MNSIICIDDFASNNFTICISSDASVYSFGSSSLKAHGHEEERISLPTQIKDLNNIKFISCGLTHSCCINYDGDVYSFGDNEYGQLGIGKNKNELSFTHIPQKIDIPSCKQVSCCNKFSICLLEDGILYSFGYNHFGQLGIGNKNAQNFPQLISDLNNVENIDCGGNHVICNTINNDYYSWGANTYGQLAQQHNKHILIPTKCLNWPNNIRTFKCGYNISLLLTEEGQVYSFGDNNNGKLGLNDKNIKSVNTPTLIKDLPEIQRIECGHTHSMCIDYENNLWVFGYNDNGELGLGDIQHRFKPILHPTLSNIFDVSSKGYHSFVKTFDNKIYAFGKNTHSQIGIDTSKRKQLTPIQVLEDNEDIWCSFIGKSKAKSARK